MSNTSSLNVINIQVRAEDQRRIDSQTPANDPTYANLAQENEAKDSKYYLWHGDHQAIPGGLGPLLFDATTGEVDEAATAARVHRFVQSMAEALPQANTLRVPFNENNFHPDGSMDIRFEAFLEEAAAQGFQIILGYFGGDAQGHGFDPSSTADDVYDDLTGHIYANMETAWTGILDWLDAHPSVQDALYGLELINEPAGYSKGASSGRGGDVDRFVELYVEHVNSLGDLIDARVDTKILVGGWAYSAHFDVFGDVMIDGTSALDLIRQGIGDDLVWSSHFYGGWHGNRNGSTLDDYVASFNRVFSVLGDDDILVTEMNARGTAANNWAVAQFNHFVFSRAAEWFAENGIGISWFPGVQSGASGLVVITGNGEPEYRHPDSFAIANHLFSNDENPAEWSGDDIITADRIENRAIRNENMSIDSNGDGVPDSGNLNLEVEGYDVGIAFGYGGNDEITGHDQAWDFLYGGDGDDTLRGLDGNDFLFGQNGNDLILGGAADDKLFGNAGNDTLEGGTGDNQLEGGDGSDLFRVETDGINVVVDYDEAEGDAVEIDGVTYTLAELIALGTQVDADLQGRANDLLIAHDNGAITLLLNVLDAPVVTVTGTANADLIGPTTTDSEGNIDGYVDPDGGTISRFDEIVYAGAGDDTVRADWGDDKVHGGDGNDVLAGDRGTDTLFGEDGNDDLNGGDGDDILDGGAGSDKLAGGDGDDLILGGDGADDLIGNAGNDTLSDGMGRDGMTGGEGNDTFVMQAGDGEQDRIKDFHIGDDVIDLASWGVDSFDELDITQRTNSNGFVANEWIVTHAGESIRINVQGVPIEQQGDQTTGGANPFTDAHFIFNDLNRIEGTEGDDRGQTRLNGTADADEILGLGGNDDLRGGAGDDVLHGGTGRDDFTGGSGSDRFVLTADDGQTDRIKDFSLSDDVIDISTWAATSLDDFHVDFRTGKTDELALTLLSDPSEVIHIRISGPDPVSIGDLTNAHFIFGNGTPPDPDPDPTLNRIDGTEGHDSGTARLNGTSGHDEIYGLGGDDDLRGAGGNDFLYDGAGKDVLTGGSGADVFVMADGDSQTDRIKDFALSDDKLDLSAWAGVTSRADLSIEMRSGKTDELEIRGPGGSGNVLHVRIVDPDGVLDTEELTADHFIF
ncbi:hypothetical protein KUV51_04125 [Tateyamaria omphalii]|uniref:calcium-binding protein n=1 Tax=Tateyamaria omphalii TaxID=299262 RepID=UPI001C996AA7|nr:calcium-binding protein [Tateyamaria omphalii]MBY5932176.1 hypothetical protein [Tateyamaria omphalii]